MTTTAAALGPVVEALVARPVGELGVAELQEQLAAVGRQVDRLLGWQSAAAGELQARTGRVVPTDDAGMRTVVLAEQRRETGSAVKTAVALRVLPLVSAAVLDGVLTPGQAGVLARLVDRFDPAALAGCDPGMVLSATHCERALEEEAERRAAAHRDRAAGPPRPWPVDGPGRLSSSVTSALVEDRARTWCRGARVRHPSTRRSPGNALPRCSRRRRSAATLGGLCGGAPSGQDRSDPPRWRSMSTTSPPVGQEG